MLTAPNFALAGPDFENVRRDVHRRYGAHFEPEVIDQIIATTVEKNSAEAKIQSFLPTLVEREVTEKLQNVLEERGKDSTPRKEVLFVCEHNAGRSQLAASIMTHHVGRTILFRTVGLSAAHGHANTETDEHDYDIYPEVIEVLKEKGYPTDVFYQKHLEARTVHRADVAVLMGVDEAPEAPVDRIVAWDIEDPKGKSLDEVRAIRDQIEEKIVELIAELAEG